MCRFSLGLMTGALLGAGMMMSVNPPDKRSMRRVYRKAEKMARRFNNTLGDWANI